MRYLLLVFCFCSVFLSTSAEAIWEPMLESGREGRLTGQKRDVYALAVSPDGKYLASASFDGTTRLWRLDDFSLVYEIPGHANWIGAVAFSPDGNILATGGLDAQVQLWHSEKGTHIQSLKEPEKGVLALAFSPDGNYLAAAGLDRKIWLYDVKTWTLLHQLEGPAGGISDLAFSPDGKYLASVGFNDLSVWLWDPVNGTLMNQLKEHVEEVYTVAFSPDGKYLASAGADKLIHLWSVDTLLPLARFAGHLQPIWAINFSPDSKILVSGSVGDQTLRFWSIPQGANIQTLVKTGEKTYDLVFSQDGHQLYSGHSDASVRLWHYHEEDPKVAHVGKPLQLALGLGGWQETKAPDARLQPGEEGVLKLKVRNQGQQDLAAITAKIDILTEGVRLDLPVTEFFIAHFEAGVEKQLSLPLALPRNLSAKALDIRIHFHAERPEGTIILPFRIPFNSDLEDYHDK